MFRRCAWLKKWYGDRRTLSSSASCKYTPNAAIEAIRRVRMVQLPFVLLSGKGGELALHSPPWIRPWSLMTSCCLVLNFGFYIKLLIAQFRNNIDFCCHYVAMMSHSLHCLLYIGFSLCFFIWIRYQVSYASAKLQNLSSCIASYSMRLYLATVL